MKKAKTDKSFAALGLDFGSLNAHALANDDLGYIGHIAKEVWDKTGGNEVELSKVFKSDASRNLIRSLANDMGEYQKTWKSALNADQGGVMKDHETAMKSIGKQWEKFNIQLTEVMSTHLAPWLEKLTGWMEKLTQNTGVASAVFKTFAFTFLLGTGIKFVQAFVSPTISALWKLAPAIKAVTFAMGGAIKVAATFLVTNPIGWAILAAAALAGIAYLVWKNWAKIKGFFIGVWDVIKGLWAKIPAWAKYLSPMTLIPALIIQNWRKIVGAFIGIYNFIKSIFSNIGKFIVGLWPTFKNAGQGLINAIAGGIKSAIMAPVNAVKTIFTNIWKFITGIFAKFKDAGKNIITSIVQGMTSVIMAPVNAVKTMVGKVRNLLPFSPAKEGPLRDIHRIKFTETIAASIKPGPLVGKATEVFGKVRRAAPAMALAASPIMPLAGAGQAQQPIQIVINIDARGAAPGAEQNIRKELMKCLPDIERALAEAADRRARSSNYGR
jgi:hypothetical protein